MTAVHFVFAAECHC